jgi:hypothetical protein
MFTLYKFTDFSYSGTATGFEKKTSGIAKGPTIQP